MSLRYCFEENYVERTLKNSKKDDLAVIDTDGIDPKIIQAAVNRGVHVYGYLNVGALEKERSYYEKLKHLRLYEYKGWPGEYWIDITDLEWKKHIVELAKKIKQTGAKGVYFDNVDIYYMCHGGFAETHSNRVGNRPVPSFESVYKALLDIMTTLVLYVGLTVMPNGGDQFVKRALKDGYRCLIKTVNQEGVIFEEFKRTSSNDKKYYTEYLDYCKKQGIYIRGIEYCKKTRHIIEAKAYYKLHGWQGLYISKHHDLKGD